MVRAGTDVQLSVRGTSTRDFQLAQLVKDVPFVQSRRSVYGAQSIFNCTGWTSTSLPVRHYLSNISYIVASGVLFQVVGEGVITCGCVYTAAFVNKVLDT